MRFAYALVALPLLCQAQKATLYLQLGHSGGVRSVAFSPNGKLVLTGGEDGSVRLWDEATGFELRRFPAGVSNVWSAAFSPDGLYVLGGGSDNLARIWDAATGREARRFEGHTQWVMSVAYSPDGRSVLTASRDGTAILRDLATGRQIQKFENPVGFETIVFSPDGRMVLANAGIGVVLWNPETGTQLYRADSEATVSAVAFSPDGKRAVTATLGDGSCVWEVPSGHKIHCGYSQTPMAVAFSPNGRNLLTADEMGGVTLWDSTTGKQVQSYNVQALSVAFSGDGRQILTGCSDGTARLFDTATGVEVRRFEGKVEASASEAYSADGRTLISSDGNNMVRVWDLTSGAELRRFGHSFGASDQSTTPNGATGLRLDSSAIAFSGDQRFVVTNANVEDGVARVWDVRSGALLSELKGHDGAIEVVAFSPDSRYVLTGGQDKTARLWDVATGKQIREFDGHSGFVDGVAFSRDASLALTAASGTVRVWNTTTGMETRRLARSASYGPEPLAVSPDGRFLAAGGHGPAIDIWDLTNGAEMHIKDPAAGSNDVFSLEFSADGRSLLSASGENAWIWDAGSGALLRRFEGHTGAVTSAAFSPNGRFVMTASADGSNRLWEQATGQWLATLVSFKDGGWAVVDPDGRFDAENPDGSAPLHWIAPDEPMRSLPLEIFMRQYFTPRLLARILAGEKLPAVPDIANLNRTQPVVHVASAQPDSAHSGGARVRVQVARVGSSGAQDLRLFRNGQLVAFHKGELKDGLYTFDAIRLPHGKPVEFSAYAFNTSLVKSETARLSYTQPAPPAPAPPRAYIVNIGVNRNRAAGCDLKYAATDATRLHEALRIHLAQLNPEAQLLVSNDAAPNGASKAAIKTALATIAGRATPDDTFVMTFSGHGYTDGQGRFFLIPSDLENDCLHFDEQHLDSAISSDELTEWMRPLDAGEMVLILDACYSGASVDSGGFRPAPMGNRGLGQLAYDKRIRILAASQSTQAASETAWLKMGLLSYALVRDGLDRGEADWQPQDGRIWLREWLSFAVDRVPKLYEALHQGRIEEFADAPRGIRFAPGSNGDRDPEAQTPALFDFAAKGQNGVRLK